MPNGVFRLVVPDLRWRVVKYIASLEQGVERGDRYAADRVLSSCILGKVSKSKSIVSSALKEYFGKSAHLWMYDFDEMKALLEAAEISENAILKTVTQCSGWSKRKNCFFAGNERELAIEATKPGT